MEKKKALSLIKEEANKLGFLNFNTIQGQTLYTPQEFFFVDMNKIHESANEDTLYIGKGYLEILSALDETLAEKKIRYDTKHEKSHVSGGRFTKQHIQNLMEKFGHKKHYTHGEMQYVESLVRAIEAHTELITLCRYYEDVEQYADDFAASLAGAVIYSAYKAESNFGSKVLRKIAPESHREKLKMLAVKEQKLIEKKLFQELSWANDRFKEIFKEKFSKHIEQNIFK